MRFWNPSQHFHHFFNSLPARLKFQVLFFRHSSPKACHNDFVHCQWRYNEREQPTPHPTPPHPTHQTGTRGTDTDETTLSMA